MVAPFARLYIDTLVLLPAKITFPVACAGRMFSYVTKLIQFDWIFLFTELWTNYVFSDVVQMILLWSNYFIKDPLIVQFNFAIMWSGEAYKLCHSWCSNRKRRINSNTSPTIADGKEQTTQGRFSDYDIIWRDRDKFVGIWLWIYIYLYCTSKKNHFHDNPWHEVEDMVPRNISCTWRELSNVTSFHCVRPSCMPFGVCMCVPLRYLKNIRQ